MSNLRYPIFKLPEYYIRDYEKRELPRYIKWWLYQSYLRKFHQKLSDIITGSNFTLEDTVLRKFNIFEVQGNTSQKTLTGRNLLPIISEQSKTQNGITLKSNGDGSYTVSGTSTAEDTITFNLAETFTLPNSTLYWHIRNSEVINGLSLYLGNVYTSTSPAFSSINRIMTSSALTNLSPTVFGVHFSSGLTVDITFSPSIELTDSVTDYEEYCGGTESPNPQFPQQIKNVTGNVNVKIGNKNLCTLPKNTTLPMSTGSTTVYETTENKIFSNITISFNFKNAKFTTNGAGLVNFKQKDNTNNYLTPSDLGLSANTLINGIYSKSYTNITFNRVIAYLGSNYSGFSQGNIDIQIEENPTATKYEEHQEQNLTFTLSSGQKLMVGDSLTNSGINHKKKQITLNGTENWELWVNNPDRTIITFFVGNKITDAKTDNLLSNYFVDKKYSGVLTEQGIGLNISNGNLAIGILKTELTSLDVDSFKTWLTNHNTLVEYELAEEETENYTTTQEEQYNAIQKAKTYKDRTYIEATSSEINPILRIQYYEKKE